MKTNEIEIRCGNLWSIQFFYIAIPKCRRVDWNFGQEISCKFLNPWFFSKNFMVFTIIDSQAITLSTHQAVIGNKNYYRCFSPIFVKKLFKKNNFILLSYQIETLAFLILSKKKFLIKKIRHKICQKIRHKKWGRVIKCHFGQCQYFWEHFFFQLFFILTRGPWNIKIITKMIFTKMFLKKVIIVRMLIIMVQVRSL